MERLRIETSSPYDILIGEGLLDRLGEEIAPGAIPCRAAVVGDDCTAALFAPRAAAALEKAGFSPEIYAFPRGEKNKSWETLGALLEWLGARRFSRSDVAVALGGGVTGDLAGFAAAVYARGMRFVQFPTTLLSAVDASVREKNGGEPGGGKKFGGRFSSARPGALRSGYYTRPARFPGKRRPGRNAQIRRAGGCGAFRAPFLGPLAGKPRRGHSPLPAKSSGITWWAMKPIRASVNFSTWATPSAMRRNAAPASAFPMARGWPWGWVMAARAAGMDAQPLAAAVSACGLPAECPYPAAALAAAALGDKKRRGGEITLVLPEKIGKCRLERVSISRLPEIFARAKGETP